MNNSSKQKNAKQISPAAAKLLKSWGLPVNAKGAAKYARLVRDNEY